MEKIVFDSGKSGPTLLVTGAVHGNEVSGPIAIRQIADEIRAAGIVLKSGKLIMVPVVHEEAYRQNVRFVQINLNRVFACHANPTLLEHHVANEITAIVNECDVYLDLHSTHGKEDRPFVFLDYDTPRNRALALATGLGTACVGWPAMYEGRGEPGSTDYAEQQGKSSILVECGGHNNPSAIQIARQSIRASLAHLGMAEIPNLSPPAVQREDVLCERIIFKKRDGMLALAWRHMDRLSAGDLLAQYDDGEEIRSEQAGYILIPFPDATIGAEWFYLGRPFELN